MPRRRSLDERIIDLATSAPPVGREEWARAMRAEFAALTGARTEWALGCLGAAIGWRIKSGWGYLAVLAATAGFCGAWPILFMPLFWALQVHLVPHSLAGPFFGLGRFLLPATLCLAFAAARPRYWALVGIGFPLVYVGCGVITTSQAFHSSIWDVHPFNATLEVGIAAMVGYCLIGAMIGRVLGPSQPRQRSSVEHAKAA